MASATPTLVFGLVAGDFVDPFDRKTIVVISVLSAPSSSAASRSWWYRSDIVWLYVLVLAVGIVQQFFDPANDSVLPEIATDEELGAANS